MISCRFFFSSGMFAILFCILVLWDIFCHIKKNTLKKKNFFPPIFKKSCLSSKTNKDTHTHTPLQKNNLMNKHVQKKKERKKQNVNKYTSHNEFPQF